MEKDPFDKKAMPEAAADSPNRGFGADLFLRVTNAVTQDGMLILDKTVKKVVADIETVSSRIKTIAASASVMRLKKNTPCAITADCEERSNRRRRCNTKLGLICPFEKNMQTPLRSKRNVILTNAIIKRWDFRKHTKIRIKTS